MNGEEFYEEFKIILGQLGVNWHGKANIQIYGRLTFATKETKKTTTIELDMEAPLNETAKTSHY